MSTPTDSRADTLLHARRVGMLMLPLITELMQRAMAHDQSKVEPPEVEVFDAFTGRLSTVTYGSPEYQGLLHELGGALKHHYAHNRHHPEFAETDVAWRAVVDYEGAYEVSSLGDVRSCDRLVPRRGTQGGQPWFSRILTASLTPKGYLRVHLAALGQQRSRLVHRLVGEAFLGAPSTPDAQINHRDGNKTNNAVANLEWVSPSTNLKHSYDHMLREPAVKYVVTCPELELTTLGTEKMASELRQRGYDKASRSGVWLAMDRDRKHCGLTFEGTLLEEWRRDRMAHVTLVDLFEMLADWKAASERHDDGDLRRSLQVNQLRFGLDRQLVRILANTADEYGWFAPPPPGVTQTSTST